MAPRLATAPAPADFAEVRSWPLLTLEDLAVLRADLVASLPPSPGGRPSLEEIPESVLLVASELATNALQHGEGPVLVRLAARTDEFLLDVQDRTPAVAPRIDQGSTRGGGGFGMQLVVKLADEVGWYTTQDSKHVWARFRVRTKAPAAV
ncbi:histidine kinase-like protein [Isoptericola jiangsuensis]|uniref:Histidine kinase-like protein n=1 Tax=Isoptericola jiangsuensis TaxID=548579 RepID=A0A2A9ERC3_9MICO|nr:ATP-binding protein [Isoptericola jiangsuensis]PFG41544.1 histidine kinase-like protein [Isoptericola jiangsuensis]